MSIKLVKRYVCVVGWRNERKKNGNRKEEQTWTTNEEKKSGRMRHINSNAFMNIYCEIYIRS